MTSPAAPSSNPLVATANALAPSPARRRELGRETVIAAALRIIDEQGLAALTIRRLAEDLGVGMPTLYAVAGSKEEILAGVVEFVLAEIPTIDADPEHGVSALREMLQALHQQLMAHPAVAQLAIISRPFGSVTARTQERILQILRTSGLDEIQAVTAYTVLTSYVAGFTLLRISQAASEHARGEGLVDQALMRQLPPESFPQLNALAPHLTNAELEQHFSEGLRKLIGCFLQ